MNTTPQTLNIWNTPHYQNGLNVDSGLLIAQSGTFGGGTHNYGALDVRGTSSFGFTSNGTFNYGYAPTNSQVALEVRGAQSGTAGPAMVFNWEGNNSLYLWNKSKGWMSFETGNGDGGYPVSLNVQGQLTVGSTITAQNGLILGNGSNTTQSATGFTWLNTSGTSVMGVDSTGVLAVGNLLYLPNKSSFPVVPTTSQVSGVSGNSGALSVVNGGLYWSNAGAWTPASHVEVYSQEVGIILHFEGTTTTTRGTQGNFSRSTNAYTPDGKLWGSGNPRFYTGKFSNGILIEEGTTNLIENSDFEQGTSNWTYNGAIGSGTLTSTTSFVGSQSYELVPSGTSTSQGILQHVSGLVSGATYTASVYMNLPVTASVRFGLEGDFTTTVSGSGTGWQRYTVTGAWNSGDTAFIIYGHNTDGSSAPIYIDSVQLEAMPYTTTYVRNDSTIGSATRAADVLYYPTSVMSTTAGSISFWVNLQNNHGRAFLFECGTDGGATFDMFHDTTSSNNLYFRTSNGSQTTQLQYPVTPSGLTHVAVTWSTNSVTLYVNGTQVANTTGTIYYPSALASNLYLGSKSDGTGQINAVIDEFYVFNQMFTANQIYNLYVSSQPVIDVFGSSNQSINGATPSTTPVPYDLVQYDAAGNIQANSIIINSGTTWGNSLTIEGTTFATQNMQVGNNAVISGTATVDNGLTVNGTTNLNGPLLVSGTITAAQPVTLNAGVTFASGTTVTNNGTIVGGVISGTTLSNVTMTGSTTTSNQILNNPTINSGTMNGTFTGTPTLAGNLTMSGGSLTLNNGTSNVISFSPNGVGAPNGTATSAGYKLKLYNDNTNSDGIGVDVGTLWYASYNLHKWYSQNATPSGTPNLMMTLDGSGNLTTTGFVAATSGTFSSSATFGPSTPSTGQVVQVNGGWYNKNQWGNIYMGMGQTDFNFDGGADGIFTFKNTNNIRGAQTQFVVVNTSGTSINILTLANNGRVGIGTTSPNSTLHVNGGDISVNDTTGATPVLLKGYNNAQSLWAIGSSSLAYTSFIVGNAFGWDSAVEYRYQPGPAGSGTGVLSIGQLQKNASTYTHGFTDLYTSGTARMRIDSSGRVGIGTTSPTSTLHVVGNAFVSGSLTTTKNTLDDGSGNITSEGNITIYNGSGSNGVSSGTAPYIFMRNYSTQNGGQATFLSNWAGSNYWGIGGYDSQTVKTGVTDGNGNFINGQTFTFKVGGNLMLTNDENNNATATPATIWAKQYSTSPSGSAVFINNWYSPGYWGFGTASNQSDTTVKIGAVLNTNGTWDNSGLAFTLQVAGNLNILPGPGNSQVSNALKFNSTTASGTTNSFSLVEDTSGYLLFEATDGHSKFLIGQNGTVETAKNTLDDGSGNMTISNIFTANTIVTGAFYSNTAAFNMIPASGGLFTMSDHTNTKSLFYVNDSNYSAHTLNNILDDGTGAMTVAKAINAASSAPANPVDGQQWYDTTNHRWKYYNSSTSSWVDPLKYQ